MPPKNDHIKSQSPTTELTSLTNTNGDSNMATLIRLCTPFQIRLVKQNIPPTVDLDDKPTAAPSARTKTKQTPRRSTLLTFPIEDEGSGLSLSQISAPMAVVGINVEEASTSNDLSVRPPPKRTQPLKVKLRTSPVNKEKAPGRKAENDNTPASNKTSMTRRGGPRSRPNPAARASARSNRGRGSAKDPAVNYNIVNENKHLETNFIKETQLVFTDEMKLRVSGFKDRDIDDPKQLCFPFHINLRSHMIPNEPVPIVSNESDLIKVVDPDRAEQQLTE